MKSRIFILLFLSLAIIPSQAFKYSLAEEEFQISLDSIFNRLLTERDSLKEVSPAIKNNSWHLNTTINVNNLSSLLWIYGTANNNSEYQNLISSLMADLESEQKYFEKNTLYQCLIRTNKIGLLVLSGTHGSEIYEEIKSVYEYNRWHEHPVNGFLIHLLAGRYLVSEFQYTEAYNQFQTAKRYLVKPTMAYKASDVDLLRNVVDLEIFKCELTTGAPALKVNLRKYLKKDNLAIQQRSEACLILAKSYKEDGKADSSAFYFEQAMSLYHTEGNVLKSYFSSVDKKYVMKTMESLLTYEKGKAEDQIIKISILIFSGTACVFIVFFYVRRRRLVRNTL